MHVKVSTLRRGSGLLRAVVFGGVHHVGKSGLGLLPSAGLETAVGVDPELFGLEVSAKPLVSD